MPTSGIEQARALYRERSWPGCCAAFTEVEATESLGAPDLLLLASASVMAGRGTGADEAFTGAYHGFVERGSWAAAARTAFWYAFELVNRGATSQGSGWAARATHLVETHLPGSTEAALLGCLEAHRLLEDGEPDAALRVGEEALRVGRSVDDAELETLSLLVAGQALVALRRIDEGVHHLDEAMVAVCADEVLPELAGTTYCAVISTCTAVHDVQRARQWTAALTRWCDTQDGLAPFRAECTLHRAEVMTVLGDWADALAEVTTACAEPGSRIAGEAWYRRGELHRLRGEDEQAETAYREANVLAREPEPGLTLLRLAQGRLEVAAPRVRRLLAETLHGPARVEVLDAAVEVLLEAGDLDGATAVATELGTIAGGRGIPLLKALAWRARGAVQLATGAAAEALGLLRDSWRTWQEIEAPFEAARVRVLVSRCLTALGDDVSALMQLDAARTSFEQLGALAELRRVAAPSSPGNAPLTSRELQVLRLVAQGLTNRQVAHTLVLSEKTVARHLSNMYLKLGVSSRAAATAYLYDQGLR